MLGNEELLASYERNVNTVWNVCITFLKNSADAEDAVQETFLRCMASKTPFESAEHEKAWLIVAARNVCKNELKRARRKTVPLEGNEAAPDGGDDTLSVVYALPEKYRLPIYLFYYEGYHTAEIAAMLHRPDASIRSDLRRGRKLMKAALEGETV